LIQIKDSSATILDNIKLNALNKISEFKLNPKAERWRFTPIKEYSQINFQSTSDFKNEFEISQFEDSIKVFVQDGEFLEGKSDEFPDGLHIQEISSDEFSENELLNTHFNKLNDDDKNYLVNENTANFSNVIFITTDSNTNIEKPVQLINFQTKSKSSPRIFINAGLNSNFSIIQQNINMVKNSIQNNMVEILLEENSKIIHCCFQEGNSTNWNIQNLSTFQQKNSNYKCSIISLSGHRNINEVHSNLKGEGAEIELDGLYIANEKAHRDNHTKIIHSSPQTYSKENFKGILADSSNGVFNGLVVVKQNAQKINSDQSNRNLLLSNSARMNSNPQLEIYADDVKCTHGSTTGQIDDDALFYMRSRGISEEHATKILVKGFAGEIIDNIKFKSIQDYINQHIEKLIKK